MRHTAGVALALVLSLGLAGTAMAADPLFARMQTDEGDILLVFYPELAPHHVDNFVHLARTGYFNGTRFHRIVPGFVIQGGDPNSKDDDPRNDGMGGPTLADVLTPEETAKLAGASAALEARGYAGISLESRANLKAEFSKTAKHLRGTLSMARSRDQDSAGSQFFICVDATPQLDRQYTVFGHVIEGMEVADAIVSAPTDPAKGREAPAVPVAVVKAEVVTGVSGLAAAEQQAYRAMRAELAEAGSTW
jgi:peptidyl-prolyl cis-trans isomerase B (cyclophilin B)